jgi:glycosyltransferase involved in cell wall biosynthesis
MRIAQIAPPWLTVPPKAYGGIELIVSLLADGLVDHGHDVTLFAPPGSQTKARLVTPLEAEAPDAVQNPWYEASHVVAAYEEAAQFDVIHDHSTAVGATVGALSGHTVVHTLNRCFDDQNDMLYRRLARRLWFVAVSWSQRSNAPPGLRWAGVVHGGIAVERYPFREDKDRHLLFVGRAAKEKAPHLAIIAARQAKRRLVMCTKARNDRDRRYWMEEVQPLLGPDVEVCGECSHEQKLEQLARAAGLLFPIQWAEPFGLVMVEAMACGTPVIGWRNGSVPEVIVDGETGYIADSTEGFVAAIGKLDRLDPKAIRAHVQVNFSAQAMVAAYEKVYQRALNGQEA